MFSLFFRDGVTVPMGPGVKTGIGKQNSYSLLYNEFIVYNPAQTRMRYLLRIQFNYSSLWWGCEKHYNCLESRDVQGFSLQKAGMGHSVPQQPLNAAQFCQTNIGCQTSSQFHIFLFLK